MHDVISIRGIDDSDGGAIAAEWHHDQHVRNLKAIIQPDLKPGFRLAVHALILPEGGQNPNYGGCGVFFPRVALTIGVIQLGSEERRLLARFFEHTMHIFDSALPHTHMTTAIHIEFSLDEHILATKCRGNIARNRILIERHPEPIGLDTIVGVVLRQVDRCIFKFHMKESLYSDRLAVIFLGICQKPDN